MNILKRRLRIYEKPTSKTLAVIGLTVLLGMVSSVSFASISWDNNATWTGSGAKAKATAYTMKKNEPHFTR